MTFTYVLTETGSFFKKMPSATAAARKPRAFVPKSQIKETLRKLNGTTDRNFRVQGAAADLLSTSIEEYCNDVIVLATKLMSYKKRRTLTVEDIKFASSIKQTNSGSTCVGLEVLSSASPTKTSTSVALQSS